VDLWRQAPFLWTVVMACLPVIPMVGTWIVMYPMASVVLERQCLAGRGDIAVSLLVISNIDNVLRRGWRPARPMHDLLVFATLGASALRRDGLHRRADHRGPALGLLDTTTRSAASGRRRVAPESAPEALPDVLPMADADPVSAIRAELELYRSSGEDSTSPNCVWRR
jgi:hypothetical protein